jgi:hypothetical protein
MEWEPAVFPVRASDRRACSDPARDDRVWVARAVKDPKDLIPVEWASVLKEPNPAEYPAEPAAVCRAKINNRLVMVPQRLLGPRAVPNDAFRRE